MVFSDSHCHLAGQYGEKLPEVLEQARQKDVNIIVGMGMSLDSSGETVKLAQSHTQILAAAGIHPWAAVLPIAEIRSRFDELCRLDQVVAIGEIGLDYIRKPETKEVQKELLIYELSLSRKTGLPVSIHCHNAHEDIMDILRNKVEPGVTGVIHGFSGNLKMLQDWLDLGFYISIGSRQLIVEDMTTLPEVIKEIPLDRLLTETDCSMRGGYPADVVQVAETLASIRGKKVEEIANIATANLRHLLKI